MSLQLFARSSVKWLSEAHANSCEIIKHEPLTSKFHTQAIHLLPIGSLTMQLNELACVLATACKGDKSILIHAHALNREAIPLRVLLYLPTKNRTNWAAMARMLDAAEHKIGGGFKAHDLITCESKVQVVCFAKGLH